MTKVAIKNENISLVAEICHVADVFLRLGLGCPFKSMMGMHGSCGKAFQLLSHFSPWFLSYPYTALTNREMAGRSKRHSMFMGKSPCDDM